MKDAVSHPLRVALVGPCASGKSTLAEALRDAGYEVRHVAQEHSYVPDMWRRVSRPDVLIYLDLTYEALHTRRPRDTGGPARLAAQSKLLAHARQHSDLYVDTTDLTPAQVAERALAFLAALAPREGNGGRAP
jgi:chloramphenicol 3-O-phosphotransferase